MGTREVREEAWGNLDSLADHVHLVGSEALRVVRPQLSIQTKQHDSIIAITTKGKCEERTRMSTG